MKIETTVKPTVKNLNSKLLNFTQVSNILEKEMANPDLGDKKEVNPDYCKKIYLQLILSVWQSLKLVYKDLLKIIRHMLKDPKFEGKRAS